MGLAGPKKRTRISHDPNNNTWSRSTDRFGHKILTAQGWTPGSTLGVHNASHSSHYTSASASHIRVTIKDDNLGLGASTVTNAHTFGLDLFQGVLGRLNGKGEEELAQDLAKRRDALLRQVVTKKMGNLTFVSGGFLVGDRIEKIVVKSQENSKKRKRDNNEAEEEITDTRGSDEKSDNESGNELPRKESRKRNEREKKEKKTKKAKRKRESGKHKKRKTDRILTVTSTATSADESDEASPGDSKAAKRARKSEKKAQREAKKAEKERRRQESAKRKVSRKSDKDVEHSVESDSTATPTPPVLLGRNLVRRRFIQQKKLSSMDQQSLKEIFMIKAPT
ncbi:hypothetical protein EJ06DRAFT_578384 [Trichodelitschia bisporula]|uniref:PinX1-related protein 1 n=1 Tax=Trichodelitschia bisporula TaxID=703511 RepID=A0A6G1IAY4_9PEZI|nr:hypothetical protein EJ06DRAFT_578384 [Trichodelitschia bisporula]